MYVVSVPLFRLRSNPLFRGSLCGRRLDSGFLQKEDERNIQERHERDDLRIVRVGKDRRLASNEAE